MTKIVVLGGGFGGVRAALDLEKSLGKTHELVLISESKSHCYIPDLYDVASALLKNPVKKDFNNLLASVDIHLEDIFKERRVQILDGSVLGIDLDKKEVELKSKTETYDFLVIALGSNSGYFGIPGAEDFSHPLKSAEDALNIRDDLAELVSNLEEGKQLEVVVAGGGFTGVELSGAMGTLLDGRGRISVIEATGNVLGGMPEWAQKEAFKRLKKLKIEVKLNCPIKSVSETEITFDDHKMAYDYLIWTAGVKGADLKNGIKGVELGKKAQVPVREDLSILEHPEVFVVGDFAQIGSTEKGFVPQAAWAAIAEAQTASKNIELLIKNLKTENFIAPKSQFVVPIGDHFGLTNLFGWQVKGTLAWMIKQFITLRYLISILPLTEALKIWRRDVTVDIIDH